MVANTVRIHLPGEVKFTDITGLVTGVGHCALKDASLEVDNKMMKSIRDFAEYGEYATRTGRTKTLTLQLEGVSLEVEALLTGADIVAEGYEGYFSEVIGPAVIGVFGALTNIPLLPGSEVIRKASDAAGKAITHRLEFSAAAPAVDTYNIVNATGVIATDGAYILYAVVNYAKYDAAAGAMLVSNDATDIALMDVILIAKAWDPVMGTKGAVTFKFEKCELIKEPGQQLAGEAPNLATVSFNVSGVMRKSVHLA